MSEPSTSGKPPRWPRFSLRTLIVAVAVAGLSISLFDTTRKLRTAQDELESLRNSVGELTISDPRRVHVIALPSYEGMTYRWRVHLPAGRPFYLKTAISQIPVRGLPDPKTSRINSHKFPPRQSATEFILTVAVHRDALGRWRLTWERERDNLSLFLSQSEAQWLGAVAGQSLWQAGNGQTESAPSGQPLILARLRKGKKVPRGFTVEMNPCDGILVWISEKQ